MVYTLFLLVLSLIMANWLCKDEKTKKMLFNIIYAATFVSSIVAIILKTSVVVLYVYFGFLIASSLVKFLFGEYGLERLIKDPNKLNQIKSKQSLIFTICLYLDVLFTIVAMCFVWQKMTYIIIAIAMLLVLIMVHEAGHYTAGKILKFKINEFSIGFGPAIFQKTKKDGEKVSLRAFPLGGYCAFEGEDEDTDHPGAFNNQKPWKRLIVLFAGVFFNFLFGIITSVVYLSVASYSLPQIIQVADGEASPFKVGDVVLSVDGNDLNYYRVSSSSVDQFSKLASKYDEDEEFVVTVLRDGKEQDIVVKREYREATRYITNLEGLEGKLYVKEGESYRLLADDEIEPYVMNMENSLKKLYKYDEESEEGFVRYEKSEVLALGGITESTDGVSLGILQTYYYQDFTFKEALLYAIPFGLDVCWLILKVLGGIFTGATAVADLGGTVTAVDQIAELTQVNISYLLYLMPMIAMNLAVFNLLPIPALDGARMVFVLIEMIRRKPISKNVEGYIHAFGLLILFGFVIFLDVYHFLIL